MNPLVSVIIPAYNAEKFIADALESVFAQTYRPLEIIVIDDGSTDETVKIVKNYQTSFTGKFSETSKTNETNLIYIYQQNSGPSKARNTGINAAKGEYIAFLDADDIWTKDKLEKQIHLFNKDQTIDIVFSNVKKTKVKNGKTETFVMFNRHNLDKTFFGHEYLVLNPVEKLLKINFMLTPSVIIKKTCFKEGFFFNEKRHYVEDWELWLKMSLYFTFGYVNDVCVHKIERGDGLSSNKLDMYLSTMDIMESFIENNKIEIDKLNLKDNFLSQYLKDQYKWMGYYLMQNKNNKLARVYYKKSLKEAFDLKTTFYYFLSFLKII